jgi:SAM-dependent methyltransferase
MHKASYKEMKKVLEERLPGEGGLIADIGSLDVNGCYKPLIPDSWDYTGIDEIEGANVDIVITDCKIPVPDNHFDFIISGQCFEHVKNPFKLMKELARVLKDGGTVVVVAPFIFAQHHRPDCFRYLPDGWESLFEESGLTLEDSYFNNAHKRNVDCWAIGKK